MIHDPNLFWLLLDERGFEPFETFGYQLSRASVAGANAVGTQDIFSGPCPSDLYLTHCTVSSESRDPSARWNLLVGNKACYPIDNAIMIQAAAGHTGIPVDRVVKGGESVVLQFKSGTGGQNFYEITFEGYWVRERSKHALGDRNIDMRRRG